jgi:predicted DNA-binding transcriptional regulator AlpA
MTDERSSIVKRGLKMVKISYKRAEELLHQPELHPREVARLLGTTEQFLFHEVWKGNLKAKKFGNDIVSFRRTDVLDWLASRSQDRN